MDDKDERDSPMANKDELFYLFIVIGAISLLLSIISCSSNNPADKSPSKETANSTDVETVKIKGVMISVGDSADTVYSQIGRGILTAATNDPAGQGSIMIAHFYASEDKTYRISFCNLDKGYYHVCRISRAELPQKIGVGNQSAVEQDLDIERHRQRDSINNNQGSPKIITNDDLNKPK
jgi:hypothetical protein